MQFYDGLGRRCRLETLLFTVHLLEFPPPHNSTHLFSLEQTLLHTVDSVFVGRAARSRSRFATLLFFLILSARKQQQQQQCLPFTASTLPLLYVTTLENVLDASEIFHSMPNSYVKKQENPTTLHQVPTSVRCINREFTWTTFVAFKSCTTNVQSSSSSLSITRRIFVF